MDKTVWATTLAVILSIATLGVAVAAYLKVPSERVQVTPPPSDGTEEFEGPVYTGTGTGYIIEFENGVKFYFAGDTCLFAGMKLVLGDFYEPDVAFLPIGNVYTMSPEAAAYATTMINPRYVIPYHYHTFPELTQTATEFVDKVDNYRAAGNTTAEAIVLEYGVEQEIEGIKVTWLGHATMLFKSVNGTRIILDPWLEANPDCPATYKNITNFGDIDLILLTHGHVDHVTMDELESLVQMYNPVVVAQWELGIYLMDHIDVSVALMNKGGSFKSESIIAQGIVPEEVVEAANLGNITITMVVAEHSSSPP